MNNKGSTELTRQPFAAIVMVLLKTLTSLLKAFWPLLLIVLFKNIKDSNPTQLYLVIGPPILIFVLAVFEFLQIKYGIIDHKFILKKGVFKRTEVSIPISSIQAVNIDQTWLDKLLSLVRVTIDATGSNDAEAKLHLKYERAIELRQLILDNQGLEVSEKVIHEENVISSLSTPELLKLGITANHLETFALIAAVFISMLQNIKTVFEDKFDEIYDSAELNSILTGFSLIIFITAAIVILTVSVSFFRTLLKYSNFKIKRTNKGFSIQSGLINKQEKLVNLDKIQFLSWKANWLRKKLPMYMLEYHVIGDQSDAKLKVNLPVASLSILAKLITVYSNSISESEAHFSISKIYVIRKTLMLGVLPALLIGTIVFYFIGIVSFVFILLPVLVFIISLKIQQKYKIYTNHEVLHIRKGAFGDSQILLKWNKIQTIQLIQSYYQQKKAVANLQINTAGGIFTIPYLDLEEAQKIQNYAVYKLESEADKRWM